MEAVTVCGREDFMCIAGDLLARWERRQAAAAQTPEHELAIAVERECLPCLIEDQE